MHQPKVVIFRAFGRSMPALVLSAREGEVSHLGQNGEPILTLAMVDPYRETGLGKDEDGVPVYPVGRIPQVFIEHDVVHASHEFSAEFKEKQQISSAAQIAALRGNGEWVEFVDEEEENIILQLRQALGRAKQEADENFSNWRQAVARADEAVAQRDAARKEVDELKAQAAAEKAARVPKKSEPEAEPKPSESAQ
jgi:hypothetical protein